MPGNPAEPLWVELTNETLTYLRSAMLYQMQQGVKKRSHARSANDVSDQVQLPDLQGVSWSYKRQRYRAVYVNPDSGKLKTHYNKNLAAAIGFVETGIKPSTKAEDDDRADDEGNENDVDSCANSDVEGRGSVENDSRADAEGGESEDETVDDTGRASAAETAENDEHTDNQ